MPVRFEAAAGLGLTLRPITAADAPFVAALYASTRAEEVARFGWPAGQQRAFLVQQHEAQERYFRTRYGEAAWLIVEREGGAVGRLYLSESGHALHVIDITLLPAVRGRGFGGALLADLLAAAAGTGRTVSMQVERNNRALRLYRRLGFDVVDGEGAYLQLESRKR